jgi:DNA-binding response OmpR family regulator
MDIQMPRMNGIEAAHKIRQIDQAKRTPIIAMTAFAMTNDRERFLQMGMDAYISKPINMEEMFQVLEQVTTEHITPPEENSINVIDKNINADITADKKIVIKESVIKKIETRINKLEDDAKQYNFENVEKLANEIKFISNQNDITDIKETAFKIELAIRRGNETEAFKNIEQLKDEFRVYQN